MTYRPDAECTPEELEARRAKRRELRAARLAKLTPEELEAQRAKERERSRAKYVAKHPRPFEWPEEKDARLKAKTERAEENKLEAERRAAWRAECARRDDEERRARRAEREVEQARLREEKARKAEEKAAKLANKTDAIASAYRVAVATCAAREDLRHELRECLLNYGQGEVTRESAIADFERIAALASFGK